jgi:GAF domain-containing protein
MPQELSKFHMSLLQVLDEAIKIDGAAKGNVQLVDGAHGILHMVVHRGFDPSFVQTFGHVRVDEPTSCARAARYRHRVIIPDIARDLLFGPYLTICKENGFRALQSTPIIGEDGLLKGVFSTHFAKPHHLSDTASRALGDCASKLARLITAQEKESFRPKTEPKPRPTQNHRPLL